MKKTIIIGGLTIIAVGAYLFFKPKKVLKDSVNQLDIDTTIPGGTTSNGTIPNGTTLGGTTLGGTTSSGTTSSGTTLGGTTSTIATTLNLQQVLDKAKEDEAKGIAIQLFSLKTQKTTLEIQRNAIPIIIGVVNPTRTNISIKIMGLNKNISDLELAIKKIGYKEVNGQAVKINL